MKRTIVAGSAGDSLQSNDFAFFNEKGMMFFRFLLTGDSFTVSECFESLNRGILLKVLETDFRVLAGMRPAILTGTYTSKNDHIRVEKWKSSNYKVWLSSNPAGDTLTTISARSKPFDPVIVSMKEYRSGYPLNAEVSNPVIGLKMQLKRIKP